MANGKKSKASGERPAAPEPESAAGALPVTSGVSERAASAAHEARKREWLRVQFLGWLANLVGEIEWVQVQLNESEGELHGAFTLDERWEIDEALEKAWSELTRTSAKPRCAPAFMATVPSLFPVPEGAK